MLRSLNKPDKGQENGSCNSAIADSVSDIQFKYALEAELAEGGE